MGSWSNALNSLARLAATALLAASCGFSPPAGAGEGAVQAASPLLPAPGKYALDPPHTFVYFAAQHQIIGKVRGRFDKMTGTIVVAKDPAECSVEVSIETASVDTQNTVRDDDLRGPDFFDAKKYPVITFTGHGIRKSGDHWVLDGSLTIRGVTKTVPLDFQFNGGAAAAQPGKPDRVGFHASAGVKRADFGMTRELTKELGPQPPKVDVWIEIDTEALGTQH
jgi:polyisoprenoid-binding protein YceI